MKPPFVYYGGKQTLASRIAALMPEHLHYVEPYCGSLAVLLAKRPSRVETVNDLEQRLVTFWRVLRDRSDELEHLCALTPHARAEHAAVLDAEPVADELETARRVWVLLTQGRGATLGRSTSWRYGISAKTDMPGSLRAYRRRLPECAERLADVSLECRPALDVVADYGRDPSVLLYVDPPYLGTTRDSTRRYGSDMRTDAEHRQLAEALRSAAAAAVLSGYHSPLYDELFEGWYRVEMAATTTQGGDDSARVEVLWSNRPLGVEMPLFELPQKGAA